MKMKGHRQALAFATAVLALPLFAYSQNATDQNSQSMQGSQAPIAGHHEATLMKPVRAELVKNLDAKKDHTGDTVQAKLAQKVTLSNGTELPKGTMLVGKVTTDDMQEQGMSKLALRFDQARLKDGTTVPVRASIVGYFGPGALDSEFSPDEGGAQMPNDWTAKTLEFDQMSVASGVDLHSRIASQNSGVFVATKKDDVKLKGGSEIQFAIAPAANNGSTQSGGQS
jgi:hypothetical protein